MPLRAALGVALFLVACTDPAPLARVPKEPRTDLPRGVVLPVRATLQGPQRVRPGEPVVLVIALERAPWFLPEVTVAVDLPAGATLSRQQKTLARSVVDEGVSELVYELDLATVPTEDFVVHLDARAPGAGYHAQLRYAFGRPTRLSGAPTLHPGPVIVAGRNLGSAVEVDSPQ